MDGYWALDHDRHNVCTLRLVRSVLILLTAGRSHRTEHTRRATGRELREFAQILPDLIVHLGLTVPSLNHFSSICFTRRPRSLHPIVQPEHHSLR